MLEAKTAELQQIDDSLKMLVSRLKSGLKI